MKAINLNPYINKLNIPAEIQQLLEAGADVALSSSGGKDSQCMVTMVNVLFAIKGYTGKLYIVHADLGENEWEQTPDEIKRQAAIEDLPVYVVKRTDGLSLMQGWERRYKKLQSEGKTETAPFSSAKNRFCTSDWKRAPIDVFLRNHYPAGANNGVICAMGIRSEESSSRAKKSVCEIRNGVNTKSRIAYNWNSIKDFTLADVWAVIGLSLSELEKIQAQVATIAGNPEKLAFIRSIGFPAHSAYALGNERLSCSLCILGSLNDLMNGATFNIEHMRHIADLEIESGKSFRQDLWITKTFSHMLTVAQVNRAKEAGIL